MQETPRGQSDSAPQDKGGENGSEILTPADSPHLLRRLLPVGFVLFLIGILVADIIHHAIFRDTTEIATEPAPLATDTVALTDKQTQTLKIAPIAARDFQVIKTSVGSIDFNQNMLVQVFTPYQGKIIAAYPNVGDKVAKGDVLFTIDSPDLLTAESTLIAASGVQTLQLRNLDRLKGLIKIGGVAQKDLDQATSDQQTAEGNVRAARDAVRIFGKTDEEVDRIIVQRRADSTLVIRSPISGVVTARVASPGLFVQPGNAPAPFNVADTKVMWMLANVVESDIPSYALGQPVSVRVAAYPDREFTGKITTLGATVDPVTRRMLVRSEIEDPNRLLRAGMFANFSIHVGEPVHSLALPANAVVREGDGTTTAWTTADRKTFTRHIVKLGMFQDGDHQLIDGVKEGELIVSDGAVFLSNKLAGGVSPD